MLLACGSAGCVVSGNGHNIVEGDGGATDSGGPWVKIILNGDPTSTHGYASLKIGGSVTFKGEGSCPESAGCSYDWDFGNGKTAKGLTPAAVAYGSEGIFHVTCKLKDKEGKPVAEAKATITAWTGKHTDTFERTNIDWDRNLLLPPLRKEVNYNIKTGWLHVDSNLQRPGSTAILSSPLIKNARVSVIIKRAPDASLEHYTDVILRMHPQKLNGSFYRVRTHEQKSGAQNNTLTLAIFRIDNPEDEHGEELILVEAPGFDPERQKNFRLTIELKDDTAGFPTFNATITEADTPDVIVLEIKDYKDKLMRPDPNGQMCPPLTYAGFVGLTHFSGDTYWDDYQIEDLSMPSAF
jgi:hypothetical protein